MNNFENADLLQGIDNAQQIFATARVNKASDIQEKTISAVSGMKEKIRNQSEQFCKMVSGIEDDVKRYMEEYEHLISDNKKMQDVINQLRPRFKALEKQIESKDQRISELELALEQARIVSTLDGVDKRRLYVLPVALGDDVFVANRVEVQLRKGAIVSKCKLYGVVKKQFKITYLDRVGKTVFLTEGEAREEAIRATANELKSAWGYFASNREDYVLAWKKLGYPEDVLNEIFAEREDKK